MENAEIYELLLNDITFGESLFNDDKRYQEYKNTTALWLSQNKKHLFADQLLNRYTSYKTLKEILKKHSGQYYSGMIVQRGTKREQVYYDLWAGDKIEEGDSFFPFFFACKLSHVSILKTGVFLQYHLENSFENEKDRFLGFLILLIRQYKTFFTPETIATINEWSQRSEQNQITLKGTEPVRIKGRKHREKGDNKTILTCDQTVLLADYFQKVGISLAKEELNYKQIGTAFQILTGYSSDSFRLKLGSKYSIDYFNLNHADFDAVYEALKKILALIDEKRYRKKRRGDL